jgi:cell division ATPase FtsA
VRLIEPAAVTELVVVAATPYRCVREVLDTVRGAGLRAIRVDHEGGALLRMSRSPLLDVGLRRSTVGLVLRGIPVVKTIPIGGESFSDALAQAYGTSFEAAEIRKRTIGLSGAAGVQMGRFTAAVAAEIRALDSDRASPVEELRLAEIAMSLQDELRLPVSRVQLSDSVDTDLPGEVQQSGAMDWFAAIAAAMPSRLQTFNAA